MGQKMIIVSGATGAVGRAYLEYFSAQPGHICIGILRNIPRDCLADVEYIATDLLDKEKTSQAIYDLAFDSVDEVVFIHCVGKFKFEKDGTPEIDLDSDGIDDEVLATNVDTFRHVIYPLISRIDEQQSKGHNISLSMCGLGSISDKHHVKYWESYTAAKDLLRALIYNLVNIKSRSCYGLFVNVSTVDTGNENLLRPVADKSYWLKPEEIVRGSAEFIANPQKRIWHEIDIYKEAPFFEENYYDEEKVLERWLKQMNKEVESENLRPGETGPESFLPKS